MDTLQSRQYSQVPVRMIRTPWHVGQKLPVKPICCACCGVGLGCAGLGSSGIVPPIISGDLVVLFEIRQSRMNKCWIFSQAS